MSATRPSGAQVAERLKQATWDSAWHPDLDHKAGEDLGYWGRRAIMRAVEYGAIFDDIKGVNAVERSHLEEALIDILTRTEFSVGQVANALKVVFPEWHTSKVNAVARSETVSVLNRAREYSYLSDPSVGLEERRFKWVGPKDFRRTDCCKQIVEESAEGVPMADLIEIQRAAQKTYFPSLSFRRHLPHPNCRHTFVEVF